MMVFCAAYECTSRTYPRVGFANVKQRRFFKFPKDELRRKRWVAILKRGFQFVPTEHTKLCDRHFLPTDYTSNGKRLKDTAVPLGPHITESQIAYKIAKEEQYQSRCLKKEVTVKLQESSSHPTDQLVSFEVADNPDSDQQNSSTTSSPPIYDNSDVNKSEVFVPRTGVTCSCKPKLTNEIGIQVDMGISGVANYSEQLRKHSNISEGLTTNPETQTTDQSTRNEHSYPACFLPPSTYEELLNSDPLGLSDMESNPTTSSPVRRSAPLDLEVPVSPIQTDKQKTESEDLIHDDCSSCSSIFSQQHDMDDRQDYTFDNEFLDSEASDDSLDTDEITGTSAEMYLVFDSCIDELFTLCKYCRNPIAEVKKSQDGSNLKVSVTCINHCSYTWSSQPSASGIATGNLLTAASILFSGMTFQRFSQWCSLLKLATISASTFYAIQRTILWPVVQEAWKSQEASLLEDAENRDLRLAGDGRCDSPGHTAKYGTYTLLDTDSDKIIAFEVVQKSEVSNSACMEKEGLIRCLKKMEDQHLTVKQIATDRHPQIACHMKKLDIDHQFDVWHVSKSVTKKLTQKSKGKKCEELRPWIRSIANHLWWSAATCDSNYTLLRDKWTSLIHHVANIHEWGHSEAFQCCEHERLTQDDVESTRWMKKGTPAYEALKDVVMEKKLLADLQHMTKFAHTGSLEVYHSMLTKYCPKRQHFPYEDMMARTMLAILDHNHNSNREYASTKSGDDRFKYEWSKISKNWVVKPVKVGKDYSYLDVLMKRVVDVRKQKLELPRIKRPEDLPNNIAPEERPDKSTLLQRHVRRFQAE